MVSDTEAPVAPAKSLGVSGLLLVSDNNDAYAIRVLLARHAVRSIDVMYYLWRADSTGSLLTAELIRAADRGVRVRMLLDDINPFNSDQAHIALNSHPNIQLRLFNPSRARDGWFRRGVELASNLFRLTRRMHNKAMIVDGEYALVGGRNVADAYFDQAETNFRDLDALMRGQATRQTMEIFERFWDCPSSVPIDRLNPAPAMGKRRALRELAGALSTADTAEVQHRANLYENVNAFIDRAGGFCWTNSADVISDPPEKADGQGRDGWLLTALLDRIQSSRQTLKITSPYFIPGKRGVATLSKLVRDGVRTTVLTNSLAATDVAAVHGGYANYRKELLRNGVALFELQPFERGQKMSMFGSKGASLHTKAFIVDDRSAFVGSFNFDPRSVSLNTEMGVLFEHEGLIGRLRELFDLEIAPDTSYRLSLEGNRLRWDAEEGGAAQTYFSEPEATLFRRFVAAIVRYLPIELQL